MALVIETMQKDTWLGNEMVVHGDIMRTGTWGGINKELPERRVSPRGSSLGSLETFGVAHPTTNRSETTHRQPVWTLRKSGSPSVSVLKIWRKKYRICKTQTRVPVTTLIIPHGCIFKSD